MKMEVVPCIDTNSKQIRNFRFSEQSYNWMHKQWSEQNSVKYLVLHRKYYQFLQRKRNAIPIHTSFVLLNEMQKSDKANLCCNLQLGLLCTALLEALWQFLKLPSSLKFRNKFENVGSPPIFLRIIWVDLLYFQYEAINCYKTTAWH